MKKLLLAGLLIASSLCAQDKYKLGLVVGLTTSHTFECHEERALLNENNHMLGLSYANSKNDFSLVTFENSFGADTIALNYLRKADTWHKFTFSYGLSLSYGYERDIKVYANGYEYIADNNFVLFDKVGILPLVSVDYKLGKSYKLVGSLVGNVLTTAIKYEFK